MPALDKLAYPGGAGAGFVIPLFKRHPGANLRMVQRLDLAGNVAGFDDIVDDDRYLKPAPLALTVEIGAPAIWAFVDANGEAHIVTRDDLAQRAPELLSETLIEQWPASAADLIRLCDLEFVLPDHTQRTYCAMVDLVGAGAAIWRDTDLILPLVRQRLGERLNLTSDRRRLLFDVWAKSVGDVCHIYVPQALLSRQTPDLAGIARTASAWGIQRLELHPLPEETRRGSAPAASWSVTGHGGVGRWTIQRMWNAVGPRNHPQVQARMGGNALEGHLAVTGDRGSPAPSRAQIVIHGSTPANVAAGAQLLGRKTPGVLQHIINIRPLGTDPEKRQFVPARSIAEVRGGPDYVWVIANHRARRASKYYDGLARSHAATRYARAVVTALADLCRSSFGRTVLQETESAHALGLVGATRFLANMEIYDLLVRTLYSMFSPEWTFARSNRIICLWPHPLPEGTSHQLRIGTHRYLVEMIGLEKSSARADIRCLAFNVSERPAGIMAYADYLASVMAAWGWDLRSGLGQEMLFEEQGAAIAMLVADTEGMVDEILKRDRNIGSLIDIVVTICGPTRAQAARAREKGWSVIHHSALPEWLQREFGEPGQHPAGGRVFPVE